MGNYSARFGGGHLEKGRNAPRQVSTLQYQAYKEFPQAVTGAFSALREVVRLSV